jgi:hypothetical protein
MLVDQAPFNGLTLAQIIGQKLSSGPQPLASLRFDLAQETIDLVERMMSRDPDARPGGYAALLAEIDAVLRKAGGGPPVVSQSVAAREGEATVIGLQAETREVRPAAAPIVSPHRTFAGWKWPALGVLLLGIVATALWRGSDRPSAVSPQRVEMIELGPARYLFNGTSMLGWTTISGQWAVPKGESVIAGQDGLLSRTLFKEVNGQLVSPDWYRLVLLVRPRDAAAAELHFGLAPVAGRNGPRYVLRLAPAGVMPGESQSDSAEFSALVERPLPITDVAVVILERLPTGWFIAVNDQPLEPLPLRGDELPEFRLAVDGGTAWFSDIEIVELVPATQQPQ